MPGYIMDKVVLISGGIHPIVAPMAMKFAALSAKLAIVDILEERLQDVADFCNNNTGFRPLTILANISNEDEARRAIQETIRHYGKLDILVNNAGSHLVNGLKFSSASLVDHVMHRNLNSVYCLTKYALPSLIRSKGFVFNILSHFPAPPENDREGYKVATAALTSFTAVIARELKPDGVTVSSINPVLVTPPGYSDTDYYSFLTANKLESVPDQDRKRAANIVSIIADVQSKGIADTGATFIMMI